jgi:hypothetical protein
LALSKLYKRYGYISFDTLKALPEYPKIEIKNKPQCKACEKGKAIKLAAKYNQKRALKIQTLRSLGVLHADLVGPITPIIPAK